MVRIYFILFLLFSINLFAQKQGVVLKATNIEALLKKSDEWDPLYQERYNRAVLFCKKKGYPTILKNEQGQIHSVVQGMDENNQLIYYAIDNSTAAKSLSINKIRPGGKPNFNATGRNVFMGIWDGGSVKDTHQEFGGRVNVIDQVPQNDYPTHVAGTMIAAGINPSAQGMAYEGRLDAYDFGNDASEMANAAASGMLISNHSYGRIVGWDYGNYSGNTGWHWFGEDGVSIPYDYKFGFYNPVTELWDDIAFNAPYYLIVKSSGNKRNEGPSPGAMHWAQNASGAWVQTNTIRSQGPFDIISPKGNAKNILTIGAVQDLPNGYQGPASVGMASFSSWGPPDDGRVKPDLVGNGISVFSCIASGNSAYQSMQGTSMSTPNVAGALALLQEHYNNLHNGMFMKAATLKGLAIHTADEAGSNPGPDY